MNGRQRGSATVLVVAALGVLLLVGAALGVVAALLVGHRRAQTAADLAVLGAAQVLRAGGDPCATAAQLADANRATLTRCVVQGATVLVEVTVPGPHWLGRTPDLPARARAGTAS